MPDIYLELRVMYISRLPGILKLLVRTVDELDMQTRYLFLLASDCWMLSQATVCAVYREALAREVEEVFSEDSNIPNRLGLSTDMRKYDVVR